MSDCDGVYRERDQLVAALSKLFESHLAAHLPADEPGWDGWRNVVCIHLPTGDVTWHIADAELPLFGHLAMRENHWDGYSDEEKYRRLNALASRTQLIP
jgi:hypothetical protein